MHRSRTPEQQVIKLERMSLGKGLPALTGHNYLNYYQWNVGEGPKQEYRFYEKRGVDTPGMWVSALVKEWLETFYELQPYQHPLDLRGQVRFIRLGHIDKTMHPKGADHNYWFWKNKSQFFHTF